MYIRDFTYRSRFSEGSHGNHMGQENHTEFNIAQLFPSTTSNCSWEVRGNVCPRRKEVPWRFAASWVWDVLPDAQGEHHTCKHFDLHQALYSLPRNDCNLNLLKQQSPWRLQVSTSSFHGRSRNRAENTEKHLLKEACLLNSAPATDCVTFVKHVSTWIHVNLLALRQHLCGCGINLSTGNVEAGECWGIWGSPGLHSEF